MPDHRLSPVAPVRPGDRIADKYVVDRFLGSGGMAVVVAARHEALDQKVAIKCLLPETVRNDIAVKRFMREAKLASRFRSEHVCKVFDVGRLATGAPYLVMEFLDGKDLARVILEEGPLSVADATTFILEAIDAIAEAHRMNIIHRDIKPSNLFRVVGEDGLPTIKVLDFGISKFSGDDPETVMRALTSTKEIIGSPLYMAPEQIQASSTVDSRSDTWALGAVLYELLTGKPPFMATTFNDLFAFILTKAPPRARDERADIPPEIEAIILRCLQRDPERRFATVAEMAEQLAPYASPSAYRCVQRAMALLGSNGTPPTSLTVAVSESEPRPSLRNSGSPTSGRNPVIPSVAPPPRRTPTRKPPPTRLGSTLARYRVATYSMASALGFIVVALGALALFHTRSQGPNVAVANANPKPAVSTATEVPAEPTPTPSAPAASAEPTEPPHEEASGTDGGVRPAASAKPRDPSGPLRRPVRPPSEKNPGPAPANPGNHETLPPGF